MNNDKLNADQSEPNILDAANELLTEGRKIAHTLLKEGLDSLPGTEEQLKHYSEALVKKIQEKPLTSILIAGGVGYVLAKALKK